MGINGTYNYNQQYKYWSVWKLDRPPNAPVALVFGYVATEDMGR